MIFDGFGIRVGRKLDVFFIVLVTGFVLISVLLWVESQNTIGQKSIRPWIRR